MRQLPIRPHAAGRRARIAAGVVVLLAACGAAWAGPRAVIAQTGVDLGEVSRGSTVEARFELRNDGDEMLRILRVKPG